MIRIHRVSTSSPFVSGAQVRGGLLYPAPASANRSSRRGTFLSRVPAGREA